MYIAEAEKKKLLLIFRSAKFEIGQTDPRKENTAALISSSDGVRHTRCTNWQQIKNQEWVTVQVSFCYSDWANDKSI